MRIDTISFADLAARFSEDEEMIDVGYQWLRSDERPNTLAVRKAIRAFNASGLTPIPVYEVIGYDGTSTKMLVIPKKDATRLRTFVLKNSTAAGRFVEYRVLQEIEL